MCCAYFLSIVDPVTGCRHPIKSVLVIYAETVTRIGYPSRPISWQVNTLYVVSMYTAHSL
jgi:hypothetical protein